MYRVFALSQAAKNFCRWSWQGSNLRGKWCSCKYISDASCDAIELGHFHVCTWNFASRLLYSILATWSGHPRTRWLICGMGFDLNPDTCFSWIKYSPIPTLHTTTHVKFYRRVVGVWIFFSTLSTFRIRDPQETRIKNPVFIQEKPPKIANVSSLLHFLRASNPL